MARRNKTSAADLMSLVALFPWWAGLALAVVSYLILHHLATPPVLASVGPAQMGKMMVRVIGVQLATIGQYVLPALCLVGAVVSGLRRHQRRRLAGHVAGSEAADVLDGMSWQQFERLVGEAFRLQGYAVAETGGGGADGGIDLVLRKGSEKFLVQCKQWRAFKVGVDVVRELYGVMAAKGATGGFVVTSGRFTAEASDFAQGRNVHLIDGPELHSMIKTARAAQPAAEAQVRIARPTPVAGPTMACPLCQKAMVRRTARRGANAGEVFWGCSDYPGCKGTRAAV